MKGRIINGYATFNPRHPDPRRFENSNSRDTRFHQVLFNKIIEV